MYPVSAQKNALIMIVICREMRLDMGQCFLNFSHVPHLHIPLVLLFFTYCFSLNLLLVSQADLKQ